MLQGPPDAKVGDFAFPCFALAKKERKNPAQLASELADQFQTGEHIEKVEATGPYLNVFLDKGAYTEHVLRRVHAEGNEFGNSKLGEGRTIVIDYSSPNIAKPLGVHHLCSTMIGNSLYRLHQGLGYKVVGVNHLGDWGTQFGAMLAAYRRQGTPPHNPTVSDLVALYVDYSARMKEDEALKQEARDWFLKLEQDDREARSLWEQFRQISLDEFERVYQRLGVRFDSYAGESFYNDQMDPVVGRIEDAGLAKVSQEALIVDLEDHGMPPCILRRSDEASLYATRDLAAIEYRKQTYNFEKNLYVVGSDQRLHFRQLFKVLELLGDDAVGKCHHVDFGLVLFHGVKGSTREGNLELLEDVLDAASALAMKIIEENEKKMDFEGDKQGIAEAVGIAAVVFGILGKSRQKDVNFDWDEILSFRGKTGPYLQYAHARQASILRKYGTEVTADVRYERLDDAEEFEPSLICNYLLELAAVYSRYSQDSVRHKVVSDDPELTAARALLVSCVRTVIGKGLFLLGIVAPERM